MDHAKLIDQIIDRYPDERLIIADGFDEAVIGFDSKDMRVVYSVTKCISILCEEMDEPDAVEYFNYNVVDAYVGERTPIFIEDDFDGLI